MDKGIDMTETLDNGLRKFSIGRVISVLLLLAIALFWIWALSPLAPSGHPDKLDNSSFADEAKILCSLAEDELEEIPFAFEVASPSERADQIDRGTAIYRALISDLLSIAPDENTRDGRLVRLWLADYSVYLDDRDAYAAKFRNGIDEAFTVTKKGSRWVTDPVDEFAKGNKIRECLVPLDV
ncbi:MAG: hypothetical protein CL453_00015 [Acidimicrobiaceae bacterium]|nr:hypothetical protein [Acidimicrobiaceae bacterium]